MVRDPAGARWPVQARDTARDTDSWCGSGGGITDNEILPQRRSQIGVAQLAAADVGRPDATTQPYGCSIGSVIQEFEEFNDRIDDKDCVCILNGPRFDSRGGVTLVYLRTYGLSMKCCSKSFRRASTVSEPVLAV